MCCAHAGLPCDKEPPQCSPTSPGQQCRAQNVNIDGEVLVLDVNSMSFSGGWGGGVAALPAGGIQLAAACQQCWTGVGTALAAGGAAPLPGGLSSVHCWHEHGWRCCQCRGRCQLLTHKH